jgi:hypothetical protein
MSFDFILTPETPIYRSVKSREMLLGEWYTFLPEETILYGPITGEFKSKIPLKLLDITKATFYNDVINKIIEYSKTNVFVNANRMLLLFPLGFSDRLLYIKYADSKNISRVPTTDVKIEIELDTQFYGNRSRHSILELDVYLITLLKSIYPEYDGIVSPIKLPNILSNGYHHSELCIFNKENIELVKELPSVQTGGTMGDPVRIVGAVSLDNEFIRRYKKSMIGFEKSLKLLSNNSIIEKQFAPYVYVSSTGEEIPQPTLNKIQNVNKKRKTRKRKD